VPITVRNTNGSQSVVAGDVTSAAAGAQQAAFTLASATDWYAGAAVFGAAAAPPPPPPADTSPPSVPGGVVASAPLSAPVSVLWNASTDNVGVTGYTVYRNGAALGDVTGGKLSYADGTAVAGSIYTYTVVAYDAAGNRSAPSAGATVTVPTPPPPTGTTSFIQSGLVTTGAKVSTSTATLSKAVAAGDLLVGWFGQYDAPGQVQVVDNVNGVWTRVQGEKFRSGTGDLGLYYVRSAAAPAGVKVTVSAAAPTYLEAGIADYGGTASPGPLRASVLSQGKSALADSGNTVSVPAGALVVTALITGGSPVSATPGSTAGLVPIVRSATGTGSVTISDVLSGGAGVQHAAFTLASTTDWYALCAVFGP
jgi:chitodextrinase